jgi:uncharacterized protein with HEPN domain
MQRDMTVLLDIVQAAHLVLAFQEGVTKVTFDADLKTQSAVLHQLIVIGEAVKRLSPAFRESHMDIPWAAIAGMRDHLIHGYDTVDLAEVWKTATVDVPSLLAALEPLIPPQE